jgi:hypothetical protein
MVGAYLLISRPASGILEYFFQMFHQNLWSNLVTGILSWVLESAMFPTWVDLFLQRKDSTGLPMGGTQTPVKPCSFRWLILLVRAAT